MSFLLLMTFLALGCWLAGAVLGSRPTAREAMRFGAALAFGIMGVDHFISAETRYLPMMPDLFGALSLPLVLFTGAAEIAAAIGLAIPMRVAARVGFPRLRYHTGVSLAVMLVFLVIANVNVAIQGGAVEGMPLGAWYYWLRPLFQPLIILWVLYAAGVVALQGARLKLLSPYAAGRPRASTKKPPPTPAARASPRNRAA